MASSAERVSRYRKALRAQRLKPVQIWIYDTKTPEMQARIAAWAADLNSKAEEAQVLAQLEQQLSETEGWTWDEEA